MQIPQVTWSAIGPPLVLTLWATALLLVDLFVANKRLVSYLALGGVVVAALVPIGN